jgi:glycosyltransferase involved in cell wall biosynthesis
MSTKNSGILWIDVTMLANWSGFLTGIQRVEYNLAKRYAEQENVKFCVFRKEQRKMTEFDFKHIAYKIDMLQNAGDNAPAGVEVAESAVPFSRRVAGKLKRTARPLVPASAVGAARKAYKSLQGAQAPVHNDPAITFTKNDTFLILSGDWSDDIFADMVEDTRKQAKCKVVQIVYDMIPAVHPGYFVPGMPEQFSRYMEKIFANCDGVLAISESTKRDIVAFQKKHNIAKVPVGVFRLGDDFVKQEAVKPNAPVQKGKFILCVCTIESRKNHQLIFYAIREAIARGSKVHPIVLVGKKGWLSGDLFYLLENDPDIKDRIIMLNKCDDQQLSWLFQNCAFTIYPSFYEGWGLPIAESLFYGKYCLASNSSSMTEIAGDIIEYYSPNDPVTLLEKLEYYTKNADALAKKEQGIAKRYKPMSWDETFVAAREFVDDIRK